METTHVTEGSSNRPHHTGEPDADTPSSVPPDAEARLRRTNRTVLLSAAGVTIAIGMVAVASGGGGAAMVLVLAGAALAAVALVRGRQSASPRPGRTAATPPAMPTDEDVAKASSLDAGDLSIDEICRLTRPGYSWWPEEDKAAFRDALADRLRRDR